jgi:hypothetical protein
MKNMDPIGPSIALEFARGARLHRVGPSWREPHKETLRQRVRERTASAPARPPDRQRVQSDIDPTALGAVDITFIEYSTGRTELLNMAKIQLGGDFGEVPDEPVPRQRIKRQATTNGKPGRDKTSVAKVEKSIRQVHDGDEDVARLLELRVPLVRTYKEGLPALDALPGSSGAIFRGKRHLTAAPAKTGKSFAELVRVADMAMEGCRIVVLDRENGRALYAERLEDIVKGRGWGTAEERKLDERLIYFEFPVLGRHGGDSLQAIATMFEADLVVFDSQRMFLTDLGLAEADSDDYSGFMGKVIDPLFRGGIATLVLDNTGHEAVDRSRGSSSKLDLHDQVYSLKQTKKFNRNKRGLVTLTTQVSRFGVSETFELELGGGHIGRWQKLGGENGPDKELRELAAAAQKVLTKAGKPLSGGTIRSQARKDFGWHGKNDKWDECIGILAGDPSCPLAKHGSGNKTSYTWNA